MKIFNKLKKVFLITTLSFSLCTTSVGTSYYQAAAVVPAVFTLLEVLFLSLGVTFAVSEAFDTDEIDDALVADIRAFADTVENTEKKSSLEQAADCIGNITNYWDNVTGLTIPETVWEGLKYYVGAGAAARPIYRPSDADINLYGCTYDQYVEYLAAKFNTTTSDTYINSFANRTYTDFVDHDYSCLFFYSIYKAADRYNYFYYGSLVNIESLHFVEYSSKTQNAYKIADQNNKVLTAYSKSSSTINNDFLCSLIYTKDTQTPVNYSSSFSTSSTFVYDPYNSLTSITNYDFFLVSHGQIYHLLDVLDIPADVSNGINHGNSVNVLTDFGIPSKEISTGFVSTGVADVMDVPADAYDVLTPGREWDKEEEKVVGDVVLPIPNHNILDDYYNGLISWDELMTELGAKPVDTSKGETFDGTAIEDAIISGTTDIVDNLLAIPAMILEGLLSLFIPSEGFFEDFFSRLNDFLEDKLGLLYAPIGIFVDLLNAIKNADTSNTTLYFPGIKFQNYVLVQEQYVDLDISKTFPQFRSACYFITNFMMVGAVLMLLQDKLKEVMSN